MHAGLSQSPKRQLSGDLLLKLNYLVSKSHKIVKSLLFYLQKHKLNIQTAGFVYQVCSSLLYYQKTKKSSKIVFLRGRTWNLKIKKVINL